MTRATVWNTLDVLIENQVACRNFWRGENVYVQPTRLNIRLPLSRRVGNNHVLGNALAYGKMRSPRQFVVIARDSYMLAQLYSSTHHFVPQDDENEKRLSKSLKRIRLWLRSVRCPLITFDVKRWYALVQGSSSDIKRISYLFGII